MKFSVSSYSFQKYLNSGEYTHLSLVEKVKEMGFDAVEFTALIVPDGKTEIEYAKEIRAEAERVGIEISSYTVGADMLNGSDGDLDKEIERIKAKVDVAEALGVKLMRHDATRGLPPTVKTKRGFNDLLPILAESYRNVTEYASTLGVKTCVENHGFFVQQSSRVEALINAVGHENFGALIDIGNFMCADEESAKAVGILAPYAFHAHAKDFHFRDGSLDAPGEGWFKTLSGDYIRGAILGHGVVRVRQCIETLARNGYDGYLALEFEGMEDPLRAIAISASNLKRLACI